VSCSTRRPSQFNCQQIGLENELVAKLEPGRVLIIDDHMMMREGVAEIIEHAEDLSVCGTASTANEGMDALKKLKLIWYWSISPCRGRMASSS
jgi:PleD family two-component response regulator